MCSLSVPLLAARSCSALYTECVCVSVQCLWHSCILELPAGSVASVSERWLGFRRVFFLWGAGVVGERLLLLDILVCLSASCTVWKLRGFLVASAAKAAAPGTVVSLVQTEISKITWIGLPWHFVLPFMVPRGWMRLTCWSAVVSCSAKLRLTFLV